MNFKIDLSYYGGSIADIPDNIISNISDDELKKEILSGGVLQYILWNFVTLPNYKLIVAADELHNPHKLESMAKTCSVLFEKITLSSRHFTGKEIKPKAIEYFIYELEHGLSDTLFGGIFGMGKDFTPITDNSGIFIEYERGQKSCSCESDFCELNTILSVINHELPIAVPNIPLIKMERSEWFAKLKRLCQIRCYIREDTRICTGIVIS